MPTTLELACGVIATGFSERPNRAFAGYILFARNLESIEAARVLSDALRGATEPQPIIAIDQEGGRVVRLRNGAEPMPSMMAIGATADVQLARDAGATLAHDLRRIGCTLDFAPVLDLALDPGNTVIGNRAFGTSTELVARMGAALAHGLEDGGITATYKHFPGHGATAFDTHLRAARLDCDEATLRERDLVPFRLCAPTASAIMAAHVAVPAIDGDRPASISRRFLTGILRDEWHYDGVCFTDCMQMDAIAKGIGSVQGVVEGIAAGADCALVSHDPDLAFEAAQALARAVDRGEVPRARLEEAYARVMRLRERGQAPIDLDAPAPYPGIGRRIARQAVTLVRGASRGNALADRAIVFGEASLAVHAPVLEEQRLGLDPTDDEVGAMLDALRASSRRAVVLAYRAHLHPRQAAAIDAILASSPDALVISTGEPYDVPLFARARHVLATYGNDEVSLAGLADVVFLGAPCAGVMPVALA